MLQKEQEVEKGRARLYTWQRENIEASSKDLFRFSLGLADYDAFVVIAPFTCFLCELEAGSPVPETRAESCLDAYQHRQQLQSVQRCPSWTLRTTDDRAVQGQNFVHFVSTQRLAKIA
nr:hypothetical protein CFP56_52846 [Quercus suber]